MTKIFKNGTSLAVRLNKKWCRENKWYDRTEVDILPEKFRVKGTGEVIPYLKIVAVKGVAK